MRGERVLVHRRGFFAAVLLILGLFLVLGPVLLKDAWALHGAEEQRLLELVNEYRQANGVDPLIPSDALSTAAEHHSEDMAAHGFFSHITEASSYYPEGSDYADRGAREGYPANAYLAENTAWGQATAEEVFEFWRNSPDHNTNMLNRGYTAVGIGHVAPYWTADFGSA
jgi:uncharacterized protein YkwD